MDQTFQFDGNVRRTHGGQIVVDSCESDESHLRHSVTDPMRNRPICRELVEACFDEIVGKAGKLTVRVTFDEDVAGATPQKEIHSAKTVEYPSEIEELVIAALEKIDGE